MISIYTEFILETSNGTCIEGSMLFPYENRCFYKPYRIIVSSGVLDLKHIDNSGKDSIMQRRNKDKIIKDFFEIKGSFAVLKEPFIYRDGKPSGVTSLVSDLIGMRANRTNNIKFKDTKYDKYKIAQLFQNPDKYIGDYDGSVVHIDKVNKEIEQEIRNLVNLYDSNLKTVSIPLKEVKNVK